MKEKENLVNFVHFQKSYKNKKGEKNNPFALENFVLQLNLAEIKK